MQAKNHVQKVLSNIRTAAKPKDKMVRQRLE